MDYNEYKYLYPPRPEHKAQIDIVSKIYDNGQFVAQPKYNGTATLIFMDGKGFLKVMNRHNEEISNPFFSEIDYQSAHTGKGFIVLCGELLNKNKRGENGLPFNKKFIIWDILVYEGKYLIGSTVMERLDLLETLYPCNRITVNEKQIEAYDHICCTNHKGIYKAPTYLNGFKKLYEEVVKTDLYEGILLKRAEGKLNYGYVGNNNSDYMLKVRKSTKNYLL